MIRLIRPEIDNEEIREVSKVLKSGFLVQGKNVNKFETVISEYLNVKYAFAVSSGTAALHLSLLALGIREGDEIILPDFTFPATGNVVALVGAKPVLVDIDLRTYDIDPMMIERKITSKTKAIIPVHEFGQSADLDSISNITKKFNLQLIEDAACALGAEYKGRKCGTIGDIGCFSFHPRKTITTGEGGMIVTNNAKLAKKIMAMRNHGIVEKKGLSRFEYAGFNYRMTDFQGAIGLMQLKKLNVIIKKRIKLAELYNNYLKEIKNIKIPFVANKNKHIYQSYVILLNQQTDRDSVIKKLKEKKIETTFGTYSLSCQPFYQNQYGYKEGEFPNSYQAFKKSLCLPLSLGLKLTDIKMVKKYLLQFFGKALINLD